MKRLLMTIVLLGMTSTVWAQASSVTQQAASAGEQRFYVTGNAGVTFGNTTSSTFGGEFGMKIGDSLELFGEGGRMTDVTSSGMQSSAATIGNWLGSLGQGAATWNVETPANFGAAGLRYVFPAGSVQPYVATSIGMANVERKTTFALNGSDVTGSLPSLGVSLGEDLSGRSNEFLFTAGGGVRLPLGAVLVDVGARYGRIFGNPGFDTFRLYFAAGVRF